MKRMTYFDSAMLLLLMALTTGQVAVRAWAAEPLRIVTWNVESEGTDPDVIAQQLQELGPYHLYGLTEVLRSDLRRYTDAIGHGKPTIFRYVHSATGNDDRLEIIFDTSRLQLIETRELFQARNTSLNDDRWRHRSPLVAKFRDKETNRRFFLMINHLARGDADLRTQQAKGLRQWAKSQKNQPMIAIGDFNFDYDFDKQQGNAAFQAFTKGNIWQWVRPAELIDSNWADFDEDGQDDYPGSILDFAFVAGGAKSWKTASRVIVRRRDFPDNERTSDHRPVELLVW